MVIKSFLTRLIGTSPADLDMADGTGLAVEEADDRLDRVRKTEITELFRSALAEKQRDMLMRRTDATGDAALNRASEQGATAADTPNRIPAPVLRLPVSSLVAAQRPDAGSLARARDCAR